MPALLGVIAATLAGALGIKVVSDEVQDTVTYSIPPLILMGGVVIAGYLLLRSPK